MINILKHIKLSALNPNWSPFVILQEFNLSLLCPCLSMGVQRLVRGQGSLLLETALQVTLEQLAGVTGSLPVPHQSFLPTSQPQPYWDQLADVYGESCFKKKGQIHTELFCRGLCTI